MLIDAAQLNPNPPPRAHKPAMFNCGTRGVLAYAFPPKFDRGTRGWFLRMTEGSPVRRKKNFPRRCVGTCAPSPFPQLTTLTNEHRGSEYQLTGCAFQRAWDDLMFHWFGCLQLTFVCFLFRGWLLRGRGWEQGRGV